MKMRHVAYGPEQLGRTLHVGSEVSMKIEDISSANLEELDAGRLAKTLDSELTVVAKPGQSALEIAEKYDDAKGGLIVVVGESGEPTAVLNPDLFLDQIRVYKGISATSLSEGIRSLLLDPQEQSKGFLHEWLNQIRIPAYWCARGQHYSKQWPCQVKHP